MIQFTSLIQISPVLLVCVCVCVCVCVSSMQLYHVLVQVTTIMVKTKNNSDCKDASHCSFIIMPFSFTSNPMAPRIYSPFKHADDPKGHTRERDGWDFLSGPVVKTLHFQCRRHSVTDRGTNTPHVEQWGIFFCNFSHNLKKRERDGWLLGV